MHVVYSIVAGKKVVDNGTLEMSANEVYTRGFKYKEEYGDGFTLNFAWVKNGIMYHHSAAIRGASPDLKLNLKLISFLFIFILL